MKRKYTIGSRGSALALWQTNYVKTELEKNFPQTLFEVRIIKTTGDAILDTALSKIGDKGLFTKQIEIALLDEEIDLAVHSLKDLPTTQPEGLRIGAVSYREKPNDVFISKLYNSTADLPKNAKVATGSLRRRSQLVNFRPDLEIVEIRGNVPTRIEKFLETDLDAMILAYAGVHRLNLDSYIKEIIPVELMLPAVGQGVMAIEIRQNDSEIERMLQSINDEAVASCITAERAFLRNLEGGCQVPIGAFGELNGGKVFLRGFVGNLNGKKIVREGIEGDKNDAEELGIRLAQKCLNLGAAEILSEARNAAQKSQNEVV